MVNFREAAKVNRIYYKQLKETAEKYQLDEKKLKSICDSIFFSTRKIN